MGLPAGVPKEDVGIMGTIYLLHFDPQYKHAKHYLGWTSKTVEERVYEHLKGEGSPLVRAATRAGHGVIIARTWADTDRFEERRMKNTKNVPMFCPICMDEEEAETNPPDEPSL